MIGSGRCVQSELALERWSAPRSVGPESEQTRRLWIPLQPDLIFGCLNLFVIILIAIHHRNLATQFNKSTATNRTLAFLGSVKSALIQIKKGKTGIIIYFASCSSHSLQKFEVGFHKVKYLLIDPASVHFPTLTLLRFYTSQMPTSLNFLSWFWCCFPVLCYACSLKHGIFLTYWFWEGRVHTSRQRPPLPSHS